MIPAIQPGAFHIQSSPYNSKEVDYSYSQWVNEKKEV